MLSLVLVCGFLLTLWALRRRKSRFEPPSFPGALPIIGHAHHLLYKEKFYDVMRAVTKYNHEEMDSDAFTIQIGPYKGYFVVNADDCLTVANTCLNKNYIYKFMKNWVGSGLLTSDAATWTRDRKLLGPAFGTAVINGFISIFNEKSKKLVRDLATQVGRGPFIPDRFVVDYVITTSSCTTMNFQNEPVVTREYMEISEELLELYTLKRFTQFWLHPDFIYNWSSLRRREEALLKSHRAVTRNAILKRKSKILDEISNNNGDYDLGNKNKPLMDLLLQLHNDGIFTETEILDHLTTGVIATFDTTYKALLNILLLIGSYTHVQERIYEEIQHIFEDSSRDVDKDDLTKMVYMEAVIKETLRLYPVTPYLGRVSENDVKLNKYVIPAGSEIILFNYALNRHPIWGPDADEYRPERWLKPGGVPDNPHTLTIFGIGRRNCIGKRYAMTLLKTTLVHILRQFRITGDVTKLRVKLVAMMTPVSGHEISLEMRG